MRVPGEEVALAVEEAVGDEGEEAADDELAVGRGGGALRVQRLGDVLVEEAGEDEGGDGFDDAEEDEAPGWWPGVVDV